MKLEFEKGSAIENPKDADIAEALPKVGGERGNFAILSETDQEYMQASRGDGATGKFTLEYREEGKQYQAVEPVSLDEVVTAFQDYSWGRSGFKECHQWRELDFPEAESGCLGAVVFCALIVALSVMAV
jgi:hypothetical protein